MSASRVAEHELRERARKEGLAHAGRAKEDEGADRPAGIFEIGARTAKRLADGDDRFVLADDLALELALHRQKLLRFLLLHAGKRNSRPLRNDVHDFVFGDDEPPSLPY